MAEDEMPERTIEFDVSVCFDIKHLEESRPSEIDAMFGAIAKTVNAAREPAPSSMTGGVQSEKGRQR